MAKAKNKIHWVHVLAVIILTGYFVLSKANMVQALTKDNPLTIFLQLYIFGAVFACIFLYIFSHDKFFPIAKEIEKREEAKEKAFLKKYFHHGKILGTFIIGAIGGPVFASLTARMLLNNFAYKYLIVMLANVPSTIFAVVLSKGVLDLFA